MEPAGYARFMLSCAILAVVDRVSLQETLLRAAAVAGASTVSGRSAFPMTVNNGQDRTVWHPPALPLAAHRPLGHTQGVLVALGVTQGVINTAMIGCQPRSGRPGSLPSGGVCFALPDGVSPVKSRRNPMWQPPRGGLRVMLIATQSRCQYFALTSAFGAQKCHTHCVCFFKVPN